MATRVIDADHIYRVFEFVQKPEAVFKQTTHLFTGCHHARWLWSFSYTLRFRPAVIEWMSDTGVRTPRWYRNRHPYTPVHNILRNTDKLEEGDWDDFVLNLAHHYTLAEQAMLHDIRYGPPAKLTFRTEADATMFQLNYLCAAYGE